MESLQSVYSQLRDAKEKLGHLKPEEQTTFYRGILERHRKENPLLDAVIEGTTTLPAVYQELSGYFADGKNYVPHGIDGANAKRIEELEGLVGDLGVSPLENVASNMVIPPILAGALVGIGYFFSKMRERGTPATPAKIDDGNKQYSGNNNFRQKSLGRRTFLQQFSWLTAGAFGVGFGGVVGVGLSSYKDGKQQNAYANARALQAEIESIYHAQ